MNKNEKFMLLYGDKDEDKKKDEECDLIYKKLKEILDEHHEIKKVITKSKFDDEECKKIKSKISIINKNMKK